MVLNNQRPIGGSSFSTGLSVDGKNSSYRTLVMSQWFQRLFDLSTLANSGANLSCYRLVLDVIDDVTSDFVSIT